MGLDNEKNFTGNIKPSASIIEIMQIIGAAAITGPITWPFAAALIAKQQGNSAFSFVNQIKSIGIKSSYAGCLPYSTYKIFGIGTQRGIQMPILTYLQQFNEY